MIISASRRTDIPYFYTDWFFQQVKQGCTYVKNPYNNQERKVSLLPGDVNCFVFWTKNPTPMIKKLYLLDKEYNYYFQFTLNPYENEIEVNLANKEDVVIPAFKNLSNLIGAEKVVWRYDPIFLSPKYTVAFHIAQFEKIINEIGPYTKRCVVSFLDIYGKIAVRLQDHCINVPTFQEAHHLMSKFVEVANKYNIKIQTCAEKWNFSDLGIEHGCCIDEKLIEKIIGKPLSLDKDKSQRALCGCVKSIDIGIYNTCKNDCIYCYAS